MIHSINFTDYTINIDFQEFKTIVKQCLSDMDKKSLIDLIWEEIDNDRLADLFEERLREAYPPPDDYDVDKEIADYYDRVRM